MIIAVDQKQTSRRTGTDSQQKHLNPNHEMVVLVVLYVRL